MRPFVLSLVLAGLGCGSDATPTSSSQPLPGSTGGGGGAGGAAGAAGKGGAAGMSAGAAGYYTGGAGQFIPKGNGVPLGETTTCQKLHDALQARYDALACNLSPVACPLLVRAAAPAGTDCSQWDTGSLDQCLAFIAAQSTCDDVVNHPCSLIILAGTAGKGCP
jgi:hypothetical protein